MENACTDSQPFIPSPFFYVEDLLKDHRIGATVGGGVSIDLFSTRAKASDGAEDHVDEIVAGPANAVHDDPSQHQSSSFPTQYG